MSTSRVRDTITRRLSEAQSGSPDVQQKALEALFSATNVSTQNRDMLAQKDGAIPTLLSLTESASSSIQILSLSILFNLSLNTNLKQSLADMETIYRLNSMILTSGALPESCKLAASLICSLAILDKNKAKFGVGGTIQALVKAISAARGPASHHHLSSLAELVQFHGNCTLAVRAGAVPLLMRLVQSADGEDLTGTSLAVLGLLARFEEGLDALKKTDNIVGSMVGVLKGSSMQSKEGAAEILIRLLDESEVCLRDALRLPEMSSVLADLSVRGSARAREKSNVLMKKMMEAELVSGGVGDKSVIYKW